MSRTPELVCVLLCAFSLYMMLLVPSYSTVPFHVVWVASSVTYGLRMWSRRVVASVIALVCVTTGVALMWNVMTAGVNPEEVTEVPMMALLFGVMVWHTERRRRMMADVERMAETEHAMREEQHEFARRASHELRTPLTIARGHVEVVRREIGGRHADDLGVALDELDRIALITKLLLALTRAEDSTLKREATDPVELVTTSVSRWARTNARVWHVTCDSPWLYVDPERVRAALDALIDNAIRYTPTGGRIDISMTVAGTDAVLQVVDTGPGIDPAILESVFEAFNTGPLTPDRRYRGTGLGLAIVRAAARAHGGAAFAENRESGAAFIIQLPLTREAESSEHIRASVVIEGSASADRRGSALATRGADPLLPGPRPRRVR